MTSEPTKNFLGIPQIGDGDHSSRRSKVTQRPASELKAKIVELFESPYIQGMTWSQYVPHFNDGDICEFSTTEVFVADSRVPEGEEDWDYTGDDDGLRWIDSYQDAEWYETGEYITGWRGGLVPEKSFNLVTKPWADDETAKVAHEAMQMISPEFYDALEESFGTYARVLFKKVDGELKVFVEEYDAGY